MRIPRQPARGSGGKTGDDPGKAVNDNDTNNDTARAGRDAADGADDSAPAGGRCPICGKPALVRWRPFCSRRCADIDLHRWLSGGYAIPAADPLPDEGEDGA